MDKDDQDQDNFKSYLNRNGYSIKIIYAGLRLHPSYLVEAGGRCWWWMGKYLNPVEILSVLNNTDPDPVTTFDTSRFLFRIRDWKLLLKKSKLFLDQKIQFLISFFYGSGSGPPSGTVIYHGSGSDLWARDGSGSARQRIRFLWFQLHKAAFYAE